MSQIHHERRSKHPFIDTVWKTENVSDGTYLATPDGSWDLIVQINLDGSRHVIIAGQSTKPAYIPYHADTSSVVISFAAAVYIPSITAARLLDKVLPLTCPDNDTFTLAGHNFVIPEFETAEVLVDRLAVSGVITYDAAVATKEQSSIVAMSERARQRHYRQATGLTMKYLQRITQAQSAIKLLKNGISASEAADQAGYTDQSHMTHSLQDIMHISARDLAKVHKLY